MASRSNPAQAAPKPTALRWDAGLAELAELLAAVATALRAAGIRVDDLGTPAVHPGAGVSWPTTLAGESDFGSRVGAGTRCPVRSNAVNATACSVLSRVDSSDQSTCTSVRVVRDEEAAGPNPATPTQVTGHSPAGRWPFPMPRSCKVQQRLRAKLPPQPLERLERLSVGDLGVDIHRHVDLRMAQDPHGHPGMHVEHGQQSGTGMSCTVMRRTPALTQRVSKRRSGSAAGMAYRPRS